MSEPLQLLVIEDTPADFLLLELHLRHEGVQAKCTRVASDAELQAALQQGGWDALLSDYDVPGMNTEAVLQEIVRTRPDLPVILVSGSVGEEKAVELLKLGIWDVVLKDRMGRLVPSLQRALREVSERRALRAEQERQLHLVENIGQGILLVDVAGNIQFTNPALDRMFGYPPRALLGQPVEVLVDEARRAAHFGKRTDYMANAAPRYLWARDRIQGRRSDGSLFPVEISLNPYHENGALVVQATISDVSDRARIERDLNLIASVFDMREGVMVTDRDNRILRVNRAFTDITGYAEEEVLGKNPSLLKSGRQKPEFYQEMWQALLRDGRWAGELDDRHKTGRIYPKWLTITAIKEPGGGISHYVGVFTDLTQNKEAERALAANKAKSEFLANMSHEIRTPMNGVVGMTDILQETPLTQEQGRMVRTIRDSALSLLGILDDILDFSKIEAGKLTLESVPTCLHDVVEEVVRLLVPNAYARDLDFHMFVDPRLPLWIMADPLRLRQIMYNLLGNAMKFTQTEGERRGRVVLRVDACSGEDGTPACRICVVDNGIGIHPVVMGQLFQPFTQADDSTTRRFGGTGLGLSITRRLVEMMEGRIEVQSTPGMGAEFAVTLPLCLAEPGHGLPEAVNLAGLRVLGAVADPFYDEVITAYLGSVGAEVHMETTLAAARQQLDAGAACGVLVVDAAMADAVQADTRLRALPLVLLGLRNSQDEKASGRVYVHKQPMLYRELLDGVAIASGKLSVRDVVGKSERRRQRRAVLPSLEQAAAAGTLVLVAEDNETNCEVIQHQLKLLGYASEAVPDGLTALERWRSGRYGLILTDYHMPRMDGFQLTAAIRAQEPAGTHIPIIAVTANALKGEAERCLAAGMDAYLAKPIRLEALGEALARWLPLVGAPAASAPVAPAPVADEAPPLWDRQALTRLVGDQPGLHRSLLDKFLLNSEQQVAMIVEAADAGDLILAADVAHKLKSAARSVGAMALGTLCQQIETAGRHEEAGEVSNLAILLRVAYDDFVQCVRAETTP